MSKNILDVRRPRLLAWLRLFGSGDQIFFVRLHAWQSGWLVGERYARLYQRGMGYGDMLYQKFIEEFGTDSCSEIQKMKFPRKFDLQSAEERGELHKSMVERQEGCRFVTSAGARLAAEVIVEIMKKDLPFPKMMADNRMLF